MFPNPQDALPLPDRPDLEQYRKLAKDLVKACKSGSREIAVWADRWMAALLGGSDQRRISRAASQVEDFALRTLTRPERHCVLADAQFVLARSHGFVSWPGFSTHLDALARSDTETAAFEAAADAIVRGEETTLRQLLRRHPDMAGSTSRASCSIAAYRWTRIPATAKRRSSTQCSVVTSKSSGYSWSAGLARGCGTSTVM